MAYNDYNLLMNQWDNTGKGGSWGGNGFSFSIIVPYTRYRRVLAQYTYYWENVTIPTFPPDIDSDNIQMTHLYIGYTSNATAENPTWTDITSTIEPTITHIGNVWEFDYGRTSKVLLTAPAIKISIDWDAYNYQQCYDTLKTYQKFFSKGSSEIFKIKSNKKTNEVHALSVNCNIQRDEDYDGTVVYCYIYNGNPYPVKCSIQNYKYYDSDGGPKTGGFNIWEQIVQPDSQITFAYFYAEYMFTSVDFDLYITAPGMTPVTRHYSKAW